MVKTRQKTKNVTKMSEVETEEGNSSNTDCDQESEVPFMDDTDEDIDTTEIEEEEEEEEEWVDYTKRSKKEAEEQMKGSQDRMVD